MPNIAAKVPDGTKTESRVKRLTRWLENARITEEIYFYPYAEILLTHLSLETLVLVMDGASSGRGCLALMLHVVYKGRALPLAWRVRQSPKGHFPEDLHIALVEPGEHVDPTGGHGGLTGGRRVRWDGACKPRERGRLVLRRPHRAMSTTAWEGTTFRLIPWGRVSSQGPRRAYERASVTRNAYGPTFLMLLKKG